MIPPIFRAVAMAALLLVASISRSVAAAPFFQPNDVIALIGGEDMVAASECGYLELVLTRAFPTHNLKVRSLAWEGDTVYEQKRDLNYPTLEQQIQQVGATVIIAQFGQPESFDGPDHAEEFAASYEALLKKLTGNGTRRALIICPTRFTRSPLALPFDIAEANARLKPYEEVIRNRAFFNSGNNRVLQFQPFPRPADSLRAIEEQAGEYTRDGRHLSEQGHQRLAMMLQMHLSGPGEISAWVSPGVPLTEGYEQLRQLIVAKNRLWFHYYRPQNWAFLAGDRTNQPSSRDHIDRNKRWFPEELEQFLPLMAAKEQEIAKLTADLAK